jgi:ATP-dependent RNA helicase DDX24/MAK5
MEEWTQFNLNQNIIDNLENLKFYTPTEIQKKVLVYTNSKVDLIVQARTGEGKTLCYGIPILNYIYNFYERAPHKQKKISPVSLILVPTRELGIQVKNHISALLKDYNFRIEKTEESDDVPELIDEEENENKKNEKKGENKKNKTINNKHIEKKEKFLYNIKIANVLGGFAKPKQIKILEKYHPEIIIATPGRLWEIISNEEADFVNKLYRLRFFVIDEADRMTEKGHFRELRKISDFIYTKLESIDVRKTEAKSNFDDYSSEDENEKEKNEDNNYKKNEKAKNKSKKAKENKLFSKYKSAENTFEKDQDDEENKKIALELKKKRNIKDAEIETIDPMMLFENMDDEMILDDEEEYLEDMEKESNRKGKNSKRFDFTKDLELNEDEYSDENDASGEEDIEENVNKLRNKVITLDTRKLNQLKNSESKFLNDKNKKVAKHLINLRTFLCSATIETVHEIAKKGKKFKNQKGKQGFNFEEEDQEKMNLDSLIKNLKFFNKCLYIKLNKFTSANEASTGEKNNSNFEGFKGKKSNLLPEKLVLDCYKCSTELKDYYLFHLLKEYESNSIIVFSNSIAHTKKLYNVFSLFDFKLSVLHSKMQQSQRMKNLERFVKKENNILFCTDVAARGLDIPSVDIVIHYHIPKTTENFIHRSGRTARAHKDGKSISLISEMELSLYKKIMKDIKINEFAMKTLNLVHLERYKSLFEYAKSIEREDHKDKKEKREKQWYEKSADQCELIFEDEDDEFDNKNDSDEDGTGQIKQMLNKKRKLDTNNKFQNKKIYQNITASGIKRTSFLSPDMVQRLNGMLGQDKLKNVNLTQVIFNANKDAQSFRFKEKQRKKRYIRRRKNK